MPNREELPFDYPSNDANSEIKGSAYNPIAESQERMDAVLNMKPLLEEFQPTRDIKNDAVRFLEICEIFHLSPAFRKGIINNEVAPEFILKDTIRSLDRVIQQGHHPSIHTPEAVVYVEQIAPLEKMVAEKILNAAQ